MPDFDLIRKRWERVARQGRTLKEKVDFPEELEVQAWIDDIAAKLSLTKDDVLLDIGCGAGVIAGSLAGYVRRLVGFDFVHEMILTARKVDKKGSYCVAEAGKVPFRENTFDKLLCNSVFQYFPDDDYACSTLSDLVRVVRHGGKIYITDIPARDFKYRAGSFGYWRKVFRKRLSNILHPVKTVKGLIYLAGEFRDSFKSGKGAAGLVHRAYYLEDIRQQVENMGQCARILPQPAARVHASNRYDMLIDIRKDEYPVTG